jgi:hypothetical protein
MQRRVPFDVAIAELSGATTGVALFDQSPLWVKLRQKLDVRVESAFPTITDIVDYGRDLNARSVRVPGWTSVPKLKPLDDAV